MSTKKADARSAALIAVVVLVSATLGATLAPSPAPQTVEDTPAERVVPAPAARIVAVGGMGNACRCTQRIEPRDGD